ncbi:MAG: DUF423 domain-containing protein [Desulfosarcinaceae bacterium]|nr:DUF423 domain-containing protein [Desulfosarcinaceae bacterium]
MTRFLQCSGAISAALAVAAGAFAAHGLKTRLAADMLAAFQTGVQYQFYHSLGLILVGLIANSLKPSKPLKAAGLLMLAGILLFSGSLYALSMTGIRALGIVTPFGGVAFMVAWMLLAVGILRQ